MARRVKTVDFSYFNNPSSKSEEFLSFSAAMIVNYRTDDSTFELVQPDSENHEQKRELVIENDVFKDCKWMLSKCVAVWCVDVLINIIMLGCVLGVLTRWSV